MVSRRLHRPLRRSSSRATDDSSPAGWPEYVQLRNCGARTAALQDAQGLCVAAVGAAKQVGRGALSATTAKWACSLLIVDQAQTQAEAELREEHRLSFSSALGDLER
jgi:hypothetical protein